MKRVLHYLMLAFLIGTVNEVSAQCDASFSYYTKGSGAFVFVDSSGQTYTKETWSFGDGRVDSTSFQRGTITHQYNSPGSFTVCRIVWDSAKGCRDTSCMTLKWTNNCKASFTYTIKGDTVVLTNTSPSGVLSNWSFGDGSNSYTRNPVKVYKSSSSNRTFNICLSTWDSSYTCFDKTCQTITIKGTGGGTGGCTAAFSVAYQRGTYTFFTKATSVANTYFYWNFGDGKKATYYGSSNASHVYQSVKKATTYQVCLFVKNVSTSCTDSFCTSVVVYPDTCNASFTTQARGGGQVLFVNNSTTSTSAGASYKWSFGDGTSSTLYTYTNPLHTYSSAGYFQVCLTVSDSSGCSSTFCDTIKVDTSNTSGGRCQANFFSTTSGKVAAFKNASSTVSGASNFYWTFGDGSSSTSASPTHTYNSAGKYNVCLVAWDSICSDTICKSITISSSSTSCKAYYRIFVDTSAGKQFKLWLINGSSNASTHTYYWTFGDGSSSTQRNPKHQYSKFGKYEICLTVADTINNCSDRFCDSIGMDSTGRLYKAEGFEVEVTDDALSVSPITTVDYKLYPNPSEGLVNVQLQAVYGGAYVRVLSIDGRLVAEQAINMKGNSQLDLRDQQDGIYVIDIFDGQSHAQTKLVKMSN